MPNPRHATRNAADRARRAARQAEIEREAAARAEAVAEEQAPAAQRVNGSAVPDAKRGGFVRADPLRRMHEQNAALVTRAHLAAANRYSLDYEVGILGASASGGVREWVDGGSGAGITDRQLNAADAYRAASDALGSLRQPVQWAALHRWPLTDIAAGLGISTQRASGYLLAALDLLVAHYHPERPQRPVGANLGMVDPDVTDIPQERLGRGREKPAA